MSRGLGRTERSALSLLADGDAADAVLIARWMREDAAPSRTQIEAVRRALKSLQRKGYVTATPEPDPRVYDRGHGEDWDLRIRHVVVYRLAPQHPPLPDFDDLWE